LDDKYDHFDTFFQQLFVPEISRTEEHPPAAPVEAGGVARDAESVLSEPKLDPEMEKYMAIVQQQREKEKQVGLALFALPRVELISYWVCYRSFCLFYNVVKTIK